MNDTPPRLPASKRYLLGTAFLAGVSGASISFLVAHAIGASAAIAATVTGLSLAGIVGALIHRHGRPSG